MKSFLQKASTLVLVASASFLQSSFADVAGEIVAIDPVDGSATVRVEAGKAIVIGEPILALDLTGPAPKEIAKGEVRSVAEDKVVAVFDSKELQVGAKTIIRQSAAEHAADLISAIPEDIYAVAKGIPTSELDAPAASKASREAILEFPEEPRFYAQLGRALEAEGKPASAILQYERALELREDYPVALHSLAKLRFYGPEELRDFVVARKHFNRAALLGYDASMPVIGTMCRDGLGGDRDYKASAHWFSIAAEKGNAFSQNALAECYENGWGLDKDISKALLWYRSSAELSYVPALRNLGRVFASGVGVEPSAKKSFDWYSRAAERDDVESQFQVGQAFLKGNGVVHSVEHALDWLKKAADAGHAQAMREIAGHYFSSGANKEDLDLAAAWFRKAAEKGDALSQFTLGGMLEKGQGLGRDKDLAINYYRQAARQGHSDSQKRLMKLKADW